MVGVGGSNPLSRTNYPLKINQLPLSYFKIDSTILT